MSLIIAGERSGAGKTTITLAILAYLARQTNQKVQAFKVGPDYIDPMFHTTITGRPSRNLDPILTSVDYVRECFELHSSQADYALVEGVMGLFDGVNFRNEIDYASTAHLARVLNLPVLLVLDCSSLSGSIAAIAYGFQIFDPRVKVAGVILNRVASDRHLELLENALTKINLPVLGVLRRNQNITIPDRHLGLVPTEELPAINKIFNQLAELAKTAFDWQRLLPLLETNHNHQLSRSCLTGLTANHQPKIKIAIARDRAFNFYYQDNLDLLEQFGAELHFWSPMSDLEVPSGVAGFYFGGGFPEVFVQELSQNKVVRQQLKQLIDWGIPVYAECGGLMYLCDRLIDLEGKTWQMVGSIPATTTMTPRLTLGYRQGIALDNTSLMNKDDIVWGHEFHRSQTTFQKPQPIWQLQGFSNKTINNLEGFYNKGLHASYLHLHWGNQRNFLQKWLQRCREFKHSL